jgi:hypothetical protein
VVAADSDTIERPQAEARDAFVEGYLELLNKDIQRGTLARFHSATVRRWQALVALVKIDRDNDRIDGDVGL